MTMRMPTWWTQPRGSDRRNRGCVGWTSERVSAADDGAMTCRHGSSATDHLVDLEVALGESDHRELLGA